MIDEALVSDDADPQGVEDEDTTSDEIVVPFDPNKIRVRLWTPTIDLVLRRIEKGEMDLAPDFQRMAGIWKDKNQSQLIESILIRIPLPTFYMDGIDEDLLAVIDGIQRLTALKRFVIDRELRLTGLEFLADLEGKSFGDLPRALQRRIEETMVTVYIIEKGTPVEAKLNLFKRINTGGLSLSAQEIRHAINPGVVRGFLKELAGAAEFKRATSNSVRPDRMDDRELVLRFLAFLLAPPDAYQALSFDAFLNQTMQSINKTTPEQREALAWRFRRTMNAAADILGNRAFRKLFPSGRRGPISKAVFEAWAVNLDACSDEQIQTLASRRDALLSEFASRLSSDQELEKALSQGTGDRNKVRLRFRVVKEILQGVLDDQHNRAS